MNNYEKTLLNLVERVCSLEEEVKKLKDLKNNVDDKTDDKSGEKDKTRYLYNGAIYLKNALVLQVVKDYVRNNPNLKYKELLKAFDKSLQGSLGVIRAKEDVIERYKDPDKRFFMNNEDILHLDDQEFVICTQWGRDNINIFLKRAKSLGFAIIPVEI